MKIKKGKEKTERKREERKTNLIKYIVLLYIAINDKK